MTGTSDTTVSWEVDAIAGGNANVGTITTEAKGAAVYTAPAQVPNPPQVIVTAVSNAQPAAQASILVNLIPAHQGHSHNNRRSVHKPWRDSDQLCRIQLCRDVHCDSYRN